MRKVLIVLLFLPLALRAQEPPSTMQIIEDIVSSREGDFDLDEIIDNLESLRQDPLDLNTATEEELGQLIFLTSDQINALINYRKWNGPLGSIYELKAVPYFDLNTIYYILPYVKVGGGEPQKLNFKNALHYGRSQLFLRYRQTLEKKAGYLPDPVSGEADYLGPPQQLYARYRYTYRRQLSAGFTLEKDPGEPFHYGPIKGADFYSAHLFIADAGRIKALALGDYSVNMGQGLLLWTGFGYSKSPFALSIKRNAPVINRYGSVNENRFFRGAASTVKLGRFSLSLFASRKKIDGNIETPDSIGSTEEFVSSFQESGLHRTPSQIADRKTIGETAAGASFGYRGKSLNLALNGVYFHFDRPFLPDSKPYRQFAFRGNQLAGGSVSYEYFWRNLLIFGETALSDNGKMATLNALQFNLDHKSSLALLYRNYDKAYHSIYSSAFGESGNVANEKGLYLGFATELNAKMKVQGYVDFFSFPWLRYRVDFPSSGREYLAMWEYSPSWNTDIYIRGRYEVKERNSSTSDDKLHRAAEIHRGSLRLHIAQRISRSVSIRNRLELSRYREDSGTPSNGVLLYQDIIWKVQPLPLSLYFRYALFQTDDYNSRIYAYESDVLYAFSVPAYSGRGIRWYVLAKYRLAQNLRIEARFARFRYPYRESIGSGSEAIEGNTKSDVTVQLQWRF